MCWTKYFNRTTSENAEKALEQPCHSEDGDNTGSQPDDFMPDSPVEVYVRGVM